MSSVFICFLGILRNRAPVWVSVWENSNNINYLQYISKILLFGRIWVKKEVLFRIKIYVFFRLKKKYFPG